MARVYQSRDLLNPAYIEILNKRMQDSVDAEKERSRKVLEAYNNLADRVVQHGGNILQSGADMADYLGRKSAVQSQFSQEELNDPYAQAAADKYIRTGDPSAMLSYRSYLGGEEERKRQAAIQDETRKWHKQIRQDEADKRERAEARVIEEKADAYIAMLEDRVARTGNINDVTGAERTTVKNYIKTLKEKGIDTTMFEARMAKLQVPAGQPKGEPGEPGEPQPGNDGKSTEQLEAEKKEREEAEKKQREETKLKIKNAAAALDEKYKTIDTTDEAAVAQFNAERDNIIKERDEAGMTAEISVKPSLKVNSNFVNAKRIVEQYKGKRIPKLVWDGLDDNVKKYISRDASYVVTGITRGK